MQISPSDPNWGMRSGFIPATCWTLIDPVPSGFCIIRWSHSYHSPILGYKKTPWVWVNQVSFLIPPWSPILIAKSLFLDTSTLVYHIEKPMRFKGILSTNSRFQRQTCVRFGRALGDETPWDFAPKRCWIYQYFSRSLKVFFLRLDIGTQFKRRGTAELESFDCSSYRYPNLSHVIRGWRFITERSFENQVRGFDTYLT